MRGITIVLSLLAALAVAGVAGCGALSSYTSGKLERMRMLRGEAPGATFVEGRVTSFRMLEHEQCEIVVDVDGQPSRQWADGPACAAFSVGSTATLARTPGDARFELKGGTYVSDGNMKFDASLLIIERVFVGLFAFAAVALGAAAFITQRRRRDAPGPRS